MAVVPGTPLSGRKIGICMLWRSDDTLMVIEDHPATRRQYFDKTGRRVVGDPITGDDMLTIL